MMANLKLSFSDCYNEVGRYLGIASLTDADDITKCKDIVYRGYRQFLFSIDTSTGGVHRWKFLEKTTTMSVEADVDTYKLPVGFSSFILTFTCTTPIAINPIQKSLSFIYGQKSQSSGTGYPNYFALKSGDYDEINGQQYEVVFYPTPSSAITYYYTYIITPPKPVNDNDVFVGDDLCSEAIMESCLAVAELRKADKQGVHYTEAERLIQALIGKDKSDSAVMNLGQMTNGKQIGYFFHPKVLDQNGTQIYPV